MSRRQTDRVKVWRAKKIQEDKDKRQNNKNPVSEKIDNTSQLTEPQFGRVIAQFGVNLQIEDDLGEVHLCQTRRNVEKLVCGDHVMWQCAPSGSGVVVELLPRQTLLSRPDYNKQVKPVAANIDLIFVVAAPKPNLDEDLINRYLVAAALTGITPAVVINKIDLLSPEALSKLQDSFSIYESFGYPVLYMSNIMNVGLDQLHAHFKQKIGIFVGQSGVGKSSLIKSLLPDLSIRIGAISEATGLGKHTTSTTVLYPFSGKGGLVDSPGVREFGLGHVSAERIAQGFIEFMPFLPYCKFNDCRHDKEPGCAIKGAVQSGEITQRRFDSFHRIVKSLGRR